MNSCKRSNEPLNSVKVVESLQSASQGLSSRCFDYSNYTLTVIRRVKFVL